MMMPSLPRAHLVVSQARFPLGPLQTFFDAMLRGEDTGEFLQGCCQRRVGQQVIMLPSAVALPLTKHHQKLRHVRCLTFSSRLNQRADTLHNDRSFLASTHLDRLPSVLRHPEAPALS